MNLKEVPYRSTKRSRATAKVVLDYMDRKRPDLPGFTRRPTMDATTIKSIRATLGLTQAALAGLVGVDVSAVENWEQGRRQPDGAARKMMMLLVVYEPIRFLLSSRLDESFAKFQASEAKEARAKSSAAKSSLKPSKTIAAEFYKNLSEQDSMMGVKVWAMLGDLKAAFSSPAPVHAKAR